MATTINAYSVSLTLEASAYIRASELSRSETGRLRRAIEDARTPAEKFTAAHNRLSNALEKGAIDVTTYNRLLDAEKRKLHEVSQATEKVVKSKLSLSGVLQKLALAYGALQVKGFIQDSVKLSIQVEQATARFEVMTGSIQNAQILMKQLRSEAAKSPITFTGMQDAAATLLQFGVANTKVMPTIQMLSAVAAGNEERFKRLALAFGQMSAAGRLMGLDLLQMINAGFNPLQEISRQTGESLIDLKKRMEAGAISSLEVAEAFRTATSEGGQFDGMADRLASTTGGKLAIAMSKLQEVMTKLGDIVGPLVTDFVSGFEKSEGAAYSLLKAIQRVVDGIRIAGAMYEWAGRAAHKFFVDSSTSLDFNNLFELFDEIEQRRFEEMFPANLPDEIVDKTSEAAEEASKSLVELFSEAFQSIKGKIPLMWEELKKAGEAFAKREKELRTQALKIYQEQQRRVQRFQQSLMQNVGQGGAEIGTSGAVAFQAKQANQKLIAGIMKTPTDERMAATLEKIYQELKRNGWGRVR